MLKQHIQTIEVGSGGAGTIVFSNIPQIYDDLYLVYSLRGTSISAGNQAVVNFNNSSATFTTRAVYAASNGGIAGYVNTDIGYAGVYSGSGDAANSFGSANLLISNYTSSQIKSYSSDSVFGSTGQAYLLFNSGRWSGTSPITTLSLRGTDTSSIWTQHSSASLYGIKRGSDGRTEVASGGTITTSGGFTIHTFTGSGTFVANRTLNAEVLVVAGGGGGGQHPTGAGAGGGGAGGYLSFVNGETSGGGVASTGPLSLTAATSYSITVGAGGAAGNSSNGADGTSSAFSSFVAVGGGGGARGNGSGDSLGNLGGSGGGSGSASGSRVPGAATAGQGFAGGVGAQQTANYGGGGGGGAGAIGGNGAVTGGSATGGNGGAGVASSITGSSVTRGGGGGASASGAGGTGGGGNGGSGGGTGQTAGSANTGGGGGGGYGSGIAAAGGSGVVIIRYLTPA